MANVLVVDDIAIMRKKISTMLIQAGHTVVAEADDGEQAFKEYEKHKPDLVMMDITMPNLDGIGAVRKIIQRFPDAKIIMVSALAQKHMVLLALQCGARNYVLKPVEDKRLLETVEKVLSDNEPRENPYNKNSSPSNNDSVKPPSMTFQTMAAPFTVENDKGVFIIKLSSGLDMSNIGTLSAAVQGFMVIKPINIVFDFNGVDSYDDEVLHVIMDIYIQIKNIGGQVRLESLGNKLAGIVTEKYGHLVSLN